MQNQNEIKFGDKITLYTNELDKENWYIKITPFLVDVKLCSKKASEKEIKILTEALIDELSDIIDDLFESLQAEG